MPIFRFHRGSLEDSLKTSVHVKNKRDLADKIINFNQITQKPRTKDDLACMSTGHIDTEQLTIRPYVFDERIGWNTHIVILHLGCVTRDPLIIGFLSEDFSD